MAKTLLHRLFGVGKIPELLASELDREGVLVRDEGIGGSVTFRNFRSPRRYASWRRQWYTAAIALTKSRVLGLRFSAPIIDVPLADARIRQMRFEEEKTDTLLVAFEAGLFHSDWSGTIEYRFRTDQTSTLLTSLAERLK